MLWGHRFLPVMSLEEGFFRVDYSQFHSTFEVPTPLYSVKEHEEKTSLPSPAATPALGEARGRRERVFSVDCIDTIEEQAGRLPSKLQRMSSGKEDLQRKVLKTGPQPSERASSMGDLPLKLQRVGSVPSQGDTEERLQLRALKLTSEPLTQSTGDLQLHKAPPPVRAPAPAPQAGGRPEDNLPAKLRRMNADR